MIYTAGPKKPVLPPPPPDRGGRARGLRAGHGPAGAVPGGAAGDLLLRRALPRRHPHPGGRHAAGLSRRQRLRQGHLLAALAEDYLR